MSLVGALNIGKSALAVQQAAIQVTGNNIANAGNADYTRQTSSMTARTDQQIRSGIFVGTGIDLTSIERQIDESLQNRIRSSVSDNESATTLQQWLGRTEVVFNELGDEDLSTKLSTFFNSWSNLANKPQDIGLRQVVLQNGDSVASNLRDTRNQLENLLIDASDRLSAQATNADAMAQKVADLNGQIVLAEGGTGGVANGLRDQRDAVLKQLSQLIDVSTIENKGVVNVYVGSEPLVMGTVNRGVGLKNETVDGKQISHLVFKANDGPMSIKEGQLGGLMTAQTRIGEVIDDVDHIASGLIVELNKIHASGQGLSGFTSISAGNSVVDASATLNDTAATGLKFPPINGSFVVHVKQKTSGLVSSTLVKVDLDGLNVDDTSLTSLAGDLDAINDISASVTPSGQLKINADSNDVEISFSQDSSGVLTSLGVNSFYTGSNALDIAVNSALKGNPSLLAAAKNGQPGDNQTALAIAGLESQPLQSIGGASLKATYQSMVNSVAISSSDAKNNAQASQVVKDTLEAQRESLSGVSLDEEAINLMRQQRAYQGAARLISTVNELMDTLMRIV